MKKIKKINSILEKVGYIAGFAGAILFFGSVGALENETISFGQFLFQELMAIGCVGIACGCYTVREYFKTKD